MRGEPTATTDPFLNAGLVGEWVRRDVAEKAVLLSTPLDRLAVEDGRIDTAVEFVQIRGVDAILEASILGLQAGDCFVVERPFVDLALAKRRYDPIQDLLGDSAPSRLPAPRGSPANSGTRPPVS